MVHEEEEETLESMKAFDQEWYKMIGYATRRIYECNWCKKPIEHRSPILKKPPKYWHSECVEFKINQWFKDNPFNENDPEKSVRLI